MLTTTVTSFVIKDHLLLPTGCQNITNLPPKQQNLSPIMESFIFLYIIIELFSVSLMYYSLVIISHFLKVASTSLEGATHSGLVGSPL